MIPAALRPEKHPVPTEYEAGLGTEPVWTIGRGENLLPILGLERRLFCRTAHSLVSHCTDYAVPATAVHTVADPHQFPGRMGWGTFLQETGQTRLAVYVKRNTMARSYTSSAILTT